jgi:AcrR family transcriptional regulator
MSVAKECTRMTKQTILENALKLFMEKGYEGASMNDIAVATGIRKASLYAHFKGKESIFTAVFADILTDYVRLIEEITAEQAGESALERLERMFMEYILYCHENSKMYFWDRYFYYPPAFIAETMQRETQETQEQFLDAITRCMERGIRSGEIRPHSVPESVLAYYYLMIGIAMSVKLYDEETLRRDTGAAWNGYQHGLATNEDKDLKTKE